MTTEVGFVFFDWHLDGDEHEGRYCRICPECNEHVMAADREVRAARRGELETGDFYEHLQHDYKHWEERHNG